MHLSNLLIAAFATSATAKTPYFHTQAGCQGNLTAIPWSTCVPNNGNEAIDLPQGDTNVQFFCYAYREDDVPCEETKDTIQTGCTNLTYERTSCNYWPRSINASIYTQSNFDGSFSTLKLDSTCNTLTSPYKNKVGSIVVPENYNCTLFDNESCDSKVKNKIASPGYHDLFTAPYIGCQAGSINCTKVA